MTDTSVFDRASRRFRAFFQELGQRFIERDDVLRQIALALLAKEHVLVCGPPGTAKSQLATAVFGRILCEDSGSPSLFSRQITESTIQTDLVGPIDFKNLMDTGRTAHFTDEGILGSTHAFLDEIFDGRDMLLRSALNVLQERELKQGATITRGRVECALMTSNRYIAEVVESSQGNLLAFVDRVAFLAFVPRGFAQPRNASLLLRRVMGGAASPPLDALLTIQDLDVLQAATDAVWIDEAVCDAVADLVARLDTELAQAVRADPDFHPTRYLSVRTAVRCGRVLRAAVIHDAVLRGVNRPHEVQLGDLEVLRHYLVLNGPSPVEVDALLAREVDPKERRQLTILKTERQIVDRCLVATKKAARPPSPRPAPVIPSPPLPPPGRSFVEAAPAPAAPAPAPNAELASIQSILARARDAETGGDVEAGLLAVRELAPLARASEATGTIGETAMAQAAAALSRSALRRTFEASATDAGSPLAAAEGLGAVVAALADDSVSLHRVVHDLASHALALIDRVLEFPLTPIAADLMQTSAGETRVDERIAILERARAVRESLLAKAGRDPASPSPWGRALARAEDEIAALHRAPFAAAVQRGLGESGAIERLVDALAPELDRLEAIESRMVALGLGASTLRAKVARDDLRPVVARAFAGAGSSTRHAIVDSAVRLEELLRTRGLGKAFATADWLAWSVDVLAPRRPSEAAPALAGLEGYRSLRKAEERAAISLVLADLALRVAPELREPAAGAAIDHAAIRAVVQQLPEPTRATAASADLDRVDRAVTYLERWWDAIAAAEGDAALQSVAESGFFQVVWDESALVRFALEAELVASILPEAEPGAKALAARITRLEQASHDRALALLAARGDAAWEHGRRPASAT
jgi:MoxR-like ATPase